jgi:hypothetical protein
LALVVLAAGLSSRYGSLKQLEAVGPSGEAIMDYGVFDAVRAGFGKVVVVVRPEIEDAVRSHFDALLHDALEFTLVHQTLDMPEGFSIPVGRVRPWGTAHAVLVAGGKSEGRFAVCNADDFYGAQAYRALAEYLESVTDKSSDYALVGFRLDHTLSELGGVSRALCETNGDGFLTAITEAERIARDADKIVGVAASGEPCLLRGSETVSMNLWGFTPAVLPALKKSFSRFVTAAGRDPDAEFLIPTAIADWVAAGDVRVQVLDARSDWMGVTFPGDKELVVHRIRQLVDRGDYPEDLATWFKNHS